MYAMQRGALCLRLLSLVDQYAKNKWSDVFKVGLRCVRFPYIFYFRFNEILIFVRFLTSEFCLLQNKVKCLHQYSSRDCDQNKKGWHWKQKVNIFTLNTFNIRQRACQGCDDTIWSKHVREQQVRREEMAAVNNAHLSTLSAGDVKVNWSH